jgi:hypothetical protein
MFINSLRLLLRFDSSVVFEEISQTNMLVQGDNQTVSVSSSGYLMQDGQYLWGGGSFSNGYKLNFSNEYTLGFWLYSLNPGSVTDKSTGNLLNVEMPLMNFIDNSSAEASVINITEHALPSGNNSLKISERDYSAFSEEYAPNNWHYFWISRSENGIRLFVDGSEHTLQDEDGTLSYSATAGGGSLLDLYINHSIEGYSYTTAKNNGIIDDILFLNVQNNSEEDIQRSINDGIKYVIDDNFYFYRKK